MPCGRLVRVGSEATAPYIRQLLRSAASSDRADEVERYSGRAASGERGDHAELEAKDRNRCGERERQRPNIHAGEHRRLECESEPAHRPYVAEDRVNGEPD